MNTATVYVSKIFLRKMLKDSTYEVERMVRVDFGLLGYTFMNVKIKVA